MDSETPAVRRFFEYPSGLSYIYVSQAIAIASWQTQANAIIYQIDFLAMQIKATSKLKAKYEDAFSAR